MRLKLDNNHHGLSNVLIWFVGLDHTVIMCLYVFVCFCNVLYGFLDDPKICSLMDERADCLTISRTVFLSGGSFV